MKASLVLNHPRIILAIGMACFIGFGLCSLFSFPTEPAWVIAGFAAFALLGAYLTAGYFLERYELSENGLVGRTVLGMNKAVEWSDLQSVQYCQYPRAWFRLTARSGAVVRVSFGLQRLPGFAQLVLSRAPSSSIDETTYTVLRSVAAGHDPPMRLN
jgi:hypothetical protein